MINVLYNVYKAFKILLKEKNTYAILYCLIKLYNCISMSCIIIMKKLRMLTIINIIKDFN